MHVGSVKEAVTSNLFYFMCKILHISCSIPWRIGIATDSLRECAACIGFGISSQGRASRDSDGPASTEEEDSPLDRLLRAPL